MSLINAVLKAATLLTGSFLLISDPSQEIRFDYEGMARWKAL